MKINENGKIYSIVGNKIMTITKPPSMKVIEGDLSGLSWIRDNTDISDKEEKIFYNLKKLSISIIIALSLSFLLSLFNDDNQLVIFLLLICYFFLFFTNSEYPPKEEHKEYVLRFKDNTSLIAFVSEKEVDTLRNIIDKNNNTEVQGINWSGREPSREEIENFNKREKEKAKIVTLYYSSMFFVFVLSIVAIFFLAL